MGEAVGVVGALQAGSQWLVGDFGAAVGLIWGGRASNIYGGGHSRRCKEEEEEEGGSGAGGSVLVCVFVFGGGVTREKGNDANVGLTTVLLLLQPRWQALAWVPIPILCSSFRVLQGHKGQGKNRQR